MTVVVVASVLVLLLNVVKANDTLCFTMLCNDKSNQDQRRHVTCWLTEAMLRHPSSSMALAIGTSHPRSDQIESDNFDELLQQWTDDDGQSSGVVTSTGR